MKLKKYMRRLNNTDLGLSGKNGCEIILDSEGKELFSHISKDEEIDFLNIHNFESFTLKKKHETSQKFTSKELKKFFTENNLQEGDYVELLILIGTPQNYFINFIYDKKLIFEKTLTNDFESNTNTKLEKFLNGEIEKEISVGTHIITISQGEKRKKRADAKDNTQFYNIEIKNTASEVIELNEKILLIDLNNYTFENKKIEKSVSEIEIPILSSPTNSFENKIFKSFIKKIEQKNEVQMDIKWNNIEFIIGQPNTGKSYNFEESNIFDAKYKNNEHYKYLKIPVSGGIGNEYKGLQSTDLAITYDPIKKELRFGEFLQILMSAIVNPNVPHVIFLDDFHNQDISSLLSEYTPLFKSQQKRDIPNIDSSHEIFNQTFSSTDEFIKIWNKFIKEHCLDIPKVPITNRISGESLYLVYPSNFYLLGAANFNANTLNIFADWEDRARITYKDPIETFTLSNDDAGFVECCKELNTKLRSILENKDIFDYEKYCFGMWKIVEPDGNPISDPSKQKDIFRFLFGMIKNSLRFNNKNSLINTIGKSLFIEMQSNDWFRSNIKEINQDLEEKEFFKILHTYNIYEEDI
jgi:hypothetical protein